MFEYLSIKKAPLTTRVAFNNLACLGGWGWGWGGLYTCTDTGKMGGGESEVKSMKSTAYIA